MSFLFWYLVVGVVFAAALLLLAWFYKDRFGDLNSEKMLQYPFLTIAIFAVVWPFLLVSFIFVMILKSDFDPAKPFHDLWRSGFEKANEKLDKLDQKLNKK